MTKINTMGKMIAFLLKAALMNHQVMARKAYINFVMKDAKVSEEEATRIVNNNIGYCAGYLDAEINKLIQEKYNCSHPYFGQA